jgi:hypothetical protein
MKTTHDNWSLLFQVDVFHSCTQRIPACFQHIETVGTTAMLFLLHWCPGVLSFLLKYVVVSIALLHASFFF